VSLDIRRNSSREGIILTLCFLHFIVYGGHNDYTSKVLASTFCRLDEADYGQICFVRDLPLVMQWFSHDSLTRSIPNRLEAMSVIFDKYDKDFLTMPKSLRRHYYILAVGYKQLSDFVSALSFYRRALRLTPHGFKS